jgi:hypothetical protein
MSTMSQRQLDAEQREIEARNEYLEDFAAR